MSRRAVAGGADPARRPDIHALLPRVRRGEVSADDFFRLTREDFERVAHDVMRRFRGRRALPADVEQCDVANRLRFEALSAIAFWDPTREGPVATLGKFCMYRARSRAQKWLNQRRGAAKAQSGQQPSRAPLLLFDIVGDGGGDDADHERVARFVQARLAREAGGHEQHDAYEAGELLARLRAAGVEAGGTVDDALAAFAASPALRRAARAALEGTVGS